jgi:hypothetical protein
MVVFCLNEPTIDDVATDHQIATPVGVPHLGEVAAAPGGRGTGTRGHRRRSIILVACHSPLCVAVSIDKCAVRPAWINTTHP